MRLTKDALKTFAKNTQSRLVQLSVMDEEMLLEEYKKTFPNHITGPDVKTPQYIMGYILEYEIITKLRPYTG